MARDLCRRANSKAYIAGSIASLGSQYVLGLKVVNCQSGDTLAQEQTTAAAKEKVLDALGTAASKLRGELGESLASVQKLDVPLYQSTTSSLEALQADALGSKAFREKGPTAELPYEQRAVELDPNFAMAYLEMARDYGTLGEVERASEYHDQSIPVAGAYQRSREDGDHRLLLLRSDRRIGQGAHALWKNWLRVIPGTQQRRDWATFRFRGRGVREGSEIVPRRNVGAAR